MTTTNPYHRVTSLKYWLISVVALLVGLLLLYISGISWFKQHETLGTLCNQLGGLSIASVALATLWELAGRRSFFQEMLEVLRLKSDIEAAGLEAVGIDYTKTIDWDASLGSVRHLDIFAAYATTWRNTNQTALTNLAARPEAKIRICLPDPLDGPCVRMLATRFSTGQPEVRSKLNEAIAFYRNLDGNSSSGRVEIYTSPVFRAFTAYRLDDHFVVTLYHHKNSRSGTVPVFGCRRGGSLYSFFEDDLEGVLNAGTKIYP